MDWNKLHKIIEEVENETKPASAYYDVGDNMKAYVYWHAGRIEYRLQGA